MAEATFDPRLWLAAFISPLVGQPESQNSIKTSIEQRKLGEAA
ncbi:MAG: hypothetical protein K0S56_1507 [Microvirga sp.]|nr:hypothetical protein [Microvirga sp.]